MSTDPHSAPQVPGGPGQPDAPSLAPESTTTTLERTREKHEPGDEDRYAHYVRKDRYTQSAIEGGPVVALCGKVWTPVRNPDRYPICPTCKAIYQNMGQGGGSWPFGPNPPSGNGGAQ
ncbi:DUF3039 domain-containing protein [Trueperella pyogenes]|uniref:DUF3039 domain-containing protein n=1 Tax=Trueperella pyogenes TaxID=1661 RepID=UPI003DA85B05